MPLRTAWSEVPDESCRPLFPSTARLARLGWSRDIAVRAARLLWLARRGRPRARLPVRVSRRYADYFPRAGRHGDRVRAGPTTQPSWPKMVRTGIQPASRRRSHTTCHRAISGGRAHPGLRRIAFATARKRELPHTHVQLAPLRL